MKDFFELGRVLKPQGVRGEVKVELFTDDISRIHDLDFVYFEENGVKTKAVITSKRTDGVYAYLLFEGVVNRNDVENYRGRMFYIDRENAAPLPEGSYYICDLIGLDVFDEKNNKLGVLKDILQHGSADVYCVSAASPFMFPSVPGIFVERDIKKGVIVVDSSRLEEVRVDGI